MAFQKLDVAADQSGTVALCDFFAEFAMFEPSYGRKAGPLQGTKAPPDTSGS
jgi:hypothetical protein